MNEVPAGRGNGKIPGPWREPYPLGGGYASVNELLVGVGVPCLPSLVMTDPAVTEPVSLSGRVLGGRFRIDRLIGEGGMGAVYEGRHVDLHRRVAIKLVHAAHLRHAEIEERFRREAQAASAIESENIVQVFDVGRDDELGLYMVMEFLKGKDLCDLVEQYGPMDPRLACSIIYQAALGLGKAHEVGIVHRDLKPANVFLAARDDGSILVKLLDFGIAKLTRDIGSEDAVVSSKKALTRVGTAVGTPQYMSPEQAQGLPNIDQRTDIYSLGGVLYEILTGAPAFPMLQSYEMTIVAVITKQAPRLSETLPSIPPELDQLVADMMSNDLERRLSSMQEVRERLLHVFPDLLSSRFSLDSLVEPISGLNPAIPSGRPLAPPPSRESRSPPREGADSSRKTTPAVTVDALAIRTELALEDPMALPTRRGLGWVMGVLALAAVLGGGFFVYTRMHRYKVIVSPVDDPSLNQGASSPASSLPMASAPVTSQSTITVPVTSASASQNEPLPLVAPSATSVTQHLRPGGVGHPGGTKSTGKDSSVTPPSGERPGAVHVDNKF